MKIGNNGNLVLGPFDESTPCLMIVLMNCQTKLRINHLTAVKSVAILENRSCDTKTEFSCRGDPPLCIALARVRDGSPDCPDGSDEGQCAKL
ncbi:alpha-2 adrenergic receptor [Trichonephila clavipes]|nr:alpha-2 adrenergic receptor [Trichonephila clavipes]